MRIYKVAELLNAVVLNETCEFAVYHFPTRRLFSADERRAPQPQSIRSNASTTPNMLFCKFFLFICSSPFLCLFNYGRTVQCAHTLLSSFSYSIQDNFARFIV